ncbi:hypothetical protein UNPF46_11580 [Bradyrhizobium sp. UNPF46]|uniref:tetraspanin family protein n=1 Tax=Bradyrhizobium sp. UNPF46 TaxID=1141168 RepID=UPI00115338F2|nr:tetraspanin family protein [Bradyrhizobium sp. UNPF46]TQF40097.1 hypothetical protein UNPF46_11580 [Bradyrhizobium sp. UNPF46]
MMRNKPRKRRTGLATAMGRSIFVLCAVALFVFTANGIASYLKLDTLTGQDWWIGFGKAAGPALIVVGVLTLALARWHEKKSFSTFCVLLFCFLVSFAASMNYWFRAMRGETKTIEVYDTQRSEVVRQLSIARDQMGLVVTDLEKLATESSNKRDLEKTKGNTCERQTKPKPGERYLFRKADAERFEGINASIKHIPTRLQDEITSVQNVKPTPGKGFATNLNTLRSALNTLQSAQSDLALEQARKDLAGRVAEDDKPRSEGKVVFYCPDLFIRGLAQGAAKRIEGFQTLRAPAIEVPDFSQAADSMQVFAMVLDRPNWFKPGGLSVSDVIALIMALTIEIGMASTASAFSRRLVSESAIDRLPEILDRDPDFAMAVVRTLAGDPDQKVREVMDLIESHEKRLFGYRRLVVLYGSKDEGARKLAWNASAMQKMGLIEPDSFLFASLRLRASMPYLFKRGVYDRLEVFRIKDDAFDELRLREFVVRVNAEVARVNEPPQQDNEPPRWQQAAE